LYPTETPAILREWAAYSGISDSTFKTPVLTENDYTYVATVEENTVSGADIVVVKYNNNGIASWKQPWTGAGLGRDQAADMVMDSLYLYICGTTYSTATNFDYVIIKMQKANGAIEWTKTFNGTANNYDIATAIAINDSSIYVTGVTSSLNTLLDYQTLKYHINGNLLWSVNFDYNNLLDIPFAISYSQEDSNIVVTGGSQSSIYDWDYQTNIYKYNGTTVDLGRVSGTSVGFDRATAVRTDSLGNIYITGATRENNSNFDIKTVKLDKLGNLIWQRTFDNNGGNDIANDLVVNNAGEIYLVGTIEGNGSDYLVMRLDASNGGIVWQNTIDCGANDTARPICFDSHGNIVITGQAFNPENANYDFLTVNFDRAGQELWRDYFDGPDHGDDNATNIASDNDGNIFVTGQTWVGNDFHTVTIKYKTDFFTQPPAVDTPAVAYLFYPNSGQLINTDDSLVTDSVHYYTLHHSPQLYFGYGMMNMVWSHVDQDTATADTLQRVDVTFANSTNPTEAYPIDEDTSSYLNYFLGHCPNGITNVHGSASLLFADVYPDIDVLYSSNNAGLKLLFIINPGASIPQEMGLAFAGDDGISVLNNWGLNVHTTLGDYEFEKPHVYQIDTGGHRIALPWHLNWNVVQSGVANFLGWGNYDSSEPLIIDIEKTFTLTASGCDKTLCWSTYIGDKLNDKFEDIEKSDDTHYYSIGTSTSSYFPIVNSISSYQSINLGLLDVVLNKFNTQGSTTSKNIDWTTFLGGSETDEGYGITTNSVGDVYIVGSTLSNDFNVKTSLNNGNYNQQSIGSIGASDAFIAKFSSSGFLKWSTYFGGNNEDIARDITCNSTDDIIVVGYTNSNTCCNQTPIFPIKADLINANSYNQTTLTGLGNWAGFITKFDVNDNHTWCSFFHGSHRSTQFLSVCNRFNSAVIDIVGVSSCDEYSTTVQVGGPYVYQNPPVIPLVVPNSGAYVQNYYPSFFGLSPTTDLIITEFDAQSNNLLYSTYFGGNGSEGNDGFWRSRIRSNNDNEFIIVSTEAGSTNLPVSNAVGGSNIYYQNTSGGGISDAFITRFINYSNSFTTYFGGNGDESGFGIIYAPNQSKYYISGITTSSQNNCCSCQVPTTGLFPICTFTGNDYVNSNYEGNTDGFIAAFNLNNELEWSTYIGGENIDYIRALLYLDDPASIYTVGYSTSPSCITGIEFPQIEDPYFYWQNCNQLSSSLYNNPYDATISRFEIPVVTSVTDKELINIINLFPNPNIGTFELSFDKYYKYIEVDIYNLLGSLSWKNSYNNINSANTFKTEIDIRNLISGMYFMQIKIDNKVFIKKLIKE
jgi:hypothetical protein